MELNAEQIKKALEKAEDTYIYLYRGTDGLWHEVRYSHILALITSQEQRIGAQDMTISELRQRAEKAEHDADRYAQKINELTEERDTFRECAYNLQKYVKSFAENQAQGYEPSAAKSAAEMEMWRVIALEKKALTEENEAKDETITNLLATIADIQADTVRKMQTEIKKTFSAICKGEMGELYRIIDQIAKEMLEGKDDNT